MAFIKNVRFAIRNLPSVVSNLKLEIEGLTTFGDVFHGPEFLHGIPVLIFMTLLIFGALRAIFGTLRKYKLKLYQTAVLSLILAISAWPLILIQFTCGCILQDLLYWSMHFIYDYFDITCAVPQYRYLYWDSPRPESCILRPEQLGFTISLASLFLAYHCGYGTLVATFCLHTAICLTTPILRCARKCYDVGMTVVYSSVTYALCQGRDGMRGVFKRLRNRRSASRCGQIQYHRLFPSRFYKSNVRDDVGETDADKHSLPCDVDIRTCEQEQATCEQYAATCEHESASSERDTGVACEGIATCEQDIATCTQDTATCKVDEHESPGDISESSTSSVSDMTSQDSGMTVRHLSDHLINLNGNDEDTKIEEDLINWESDESDGTKVYDLGEWLDEKESLPHIPKVGVIDFYSFL